MTDQVRTYTYQKAIARCIDRLEGKVVMDVGSGSGILSMFMAVQGGAKRVYAVEANTKVAKVSERIIAVNGLQGIGKSCFFSLERLFYGGLCVW